MARIWNRGLAHPSLFPREFVEMCVRAHWQGPAALEVGNVVGFASQYNPLIFPKSMESSYHPNVGADAHPPFGKVWGALGAATVLGMSRGKWSLRACSGFLGELKTVLYVLHGLYEGSHRIQG